MNEPLPTILLVEDDDVAAEGVVRSLNRSGAPFPVVWAEDGVAALAALRGEDPQRSVPRPRLILLDLNMPRMNGFEFLQQLREDARLCDDVVFVLAEFQIVHRARAAANERGDSSHAKYKHRQHQRVRERLLREPKKSSPRKA